MVYIEKVRGDLELGGERECGAQGTSTPSTMQVLLLLPRASQGVWMNLPEGVIQTSILKGTLGK